MIAKRYIWLLVLCCLSACSSRPLDEALKVVAEADSLWTKGKMYSDSAVLAQAYLDLGEQADKFPTEYVHACYHYGRLLREHDDPVSAMQAFINATHTASTDCHILGRIYSNMGDMAHLAGEFAISYDLFEKSADMFQRNGDTINYYYGLNNMAVELAAQGDSVQTLTFLDSVRRYPDDALRLKTYETEAMLCQTLQNYNGVIGLLDSLQAHGYREVLGYMMKARAFNYLGVTDSALWYAQKVTSIAPEHNASIAAYYILSHDTTIGTDSLLVLSSARADVQKAWAYEHGELARAVQLVELDSPDKEDNRRLYVIITIVMFVSTTICIIVIWRRRKRLMQKQFASFSDKQRARVIDSIKKHIDVTDLNKTLHWKDYTAMKSETDLYMGGMVTKLEAHHLNETEIRFCILTVLDFPQKKIADTICYSYPSGIKTLKKRISDKLGTTPPELKEYILRKL